jgi:hydroxyacylglutathione hydrolase
LSILQRERLKLTTILVTHHHWDHVAGVQDLKDNTGCEVIGPDDKRIPCIDRVVGDGEVLSVGREDIEAIATPGHTSTSVCYYLQPSGSNKAGVLWTGDTLFTGGCGRLLECSAQSMWESLRKLASLPDETLVYCGHDYTLENYEFALTIEPGNQAVKQRLQETRPAQKQGRQIVPSTISQEKMTNPFLRVRTAKEFAALRRKKDSF